MRLVPLDSFQDPFIFSSFIPIFVAEMEPKSKAFDYVIIGGGTAGLILAARLTENPEVHVVVLEAGEKRLDVSQSWIQK